MEQKCVDLERKGREKPFVTSKTSLSAWGFLDLVMPPIMKILVCFSNMDHTHILQGGNMAAVSAPCGLCEICRGCVGVRQIQFDVQYTGNKNQSQQTDSLT